jgi:acetyl esterase/lipase
MLTALPRPLAALLLSAGFASTLLAADVPQVRIEKDVAYLPPDRAEKADLYLPPDDTARHPGVLIVHGGGWTGGDKAAAREQNIGNTLASHGYVCRVQDKKVTSGGGS